MTTDSDSECSYVANLVDFNVIRVIIVIIEIVTVIVKIVMVIIIIIVGIIVIVIRVILIVIIVYTSNKINNSSNKSNNNNSNCNTIWEKVHWNRVTNTQNAQCKMTGWWWLAFTSSRIDVIPEIAEDFRWFASSC